MFQRLRKPSLLLAASLAVVALGCEDPTDTTTLTPPAPESTAVQPLSSAEPLSSTDSVPATESMPATDRATADANPDEANANQTFVAVCTLEPVGDSGVEGTVNFTQEGDTVTVTGEVTGLQPGKHGFHVHEKGDLSDKETGKSAGGHFNPTGQKHGKPSDAERHVGDLGNITADDEGVAKIDIQDKVISLHGENTIIGKSIVVHAGEDVFTQPTGDAGARSAFGVIEEQDAS